MLIDPVTQAPCPFDPAKMDSYFVTRILMTVTAYAYSESILVTALVYTFLGLVIEILERVNAIDERQTTPNEAQASIDQPKTAEGSSQAPSAVGSALVQYLTTFERSISQRLDRIENSVRESQRRV